VTGFAPDALATETGAERGRVMTPENYMKEMANSKICLAPRGTSLETFRHYCKGNGLRPREDLLFRETSRWGWRRTQ
jgi:hypothetical protein